MKEVTKEFLSAITWRREPYTVEDFGETGIDQDPDNTTLFTLSECAFAMKDISDLVGSFTVVGFSTELRLFICRPSSYTKP